MKKLFFIFLYKIILKPFLKIIVGVNYFIHDDFYDVKQAIIVANHNSHIDTVAILTSLPLQLLDKVHPVAATDYFGKNMLTSFLSKTLINTLLVDRKMGQGENKDNPIEKMLKVLGEGKSILIFPEGTRGEVNKIEEFKKGVAILLKENPTIPYVPAFLKNTGKALPRGDSMLVPYDSELHIGKPERIDKDNSIEEILEKVKSSVLNLES